MQVNNFSKNPNWETSTTNGVKYLSNQYTKKTYAYVSTKEVRKTMLQTLFFTAVWQIRAIAKNIFTRISFVLNEKKKPSDYEIVHDFKTFFNLECAAVYGLFSPYDGAVRYQTIIKDKYPDKKPNFCPKILIYPEPVSQPEKPKLETNVPIEKIFKDILAFEEKQNFPSQGRIKSNLIKSIVDYLQNNLFCYEVEKTIENALEKIKSLQVNYNESQKNKVCEIKFNQITKEEIKKTIFQRVVSGKELQIKIKSLVLKNFNEFYFSLKEGAVSSEQIQYSGNLSPLLELIFPDDPIYLFQVLETVEWFKEDPGLNDFADMLQKTNDFLTFHKQATENIPYHLNHLGKKLEQAATDIKPLLDAQGVLNMHNPTEKALFHQIKLWDELKNKLNLSTDLDAKMNTEDDELIQQIIGKSYVTDLGVIQEWINNHRNDDLQEFENWLEIQTRTRFDNLALLYEQYTSHHT